jgi:hypothetical protein
MDIININDPISGYNIILTKSIISFITKKPTYILKVKKPESFNLGNQEQLKHMEFYDDFIEDIIKLYQLKPTESTVIDNKTIRIIIYMHNL